MAAVVNLRPFSEPAEARPAPSALAATAALGAAPLTSPTGGDPGEGAPESRGSSASWVSTTYFAEGLPYSIVHQVSAEFFTALGASLSTIGLTSLYGLAWNFKFLWSPLVDRLASPKKWVLACEVALALTVAALAWPAGLGLTGMVARLFVAVALVAATHDIAIDGFYMAALRPERQVEHVGLRIAAYRIAMVVGKGGLVALAGLVSFRVCFLVAGATLAGLAALHARSLPDPPRPTLATRSEAAVGHVDETSFARAFVTFFQKEKIGVSMAFLLTFRAGDAMLFAMNSPFLKELGLDTALRGVVQGLGGTLASIAGALIGARLIAKATLARALLPIAALQALALLLYVALAAVRPPPGVWIAAVVLVEQLVAGIGTAAFAIFILGLARGRYQASHTAVATALMSVATTGAGAASGYLAEAIGFTSFFTVAFLAALPGVGFAALVSRNRGTPASSP